MRKHHQRGRRPLAHSSREGGLDAVRLKTRASMQIQNVRLALPGITPGFPKEERMSEHAELPEALQPDPPAPAAKEEKVYPGSLERYRTLRSMREVQEQQGEVDPSLMVCEELAGLAYLIDGIRF